MPINSGVVLLKHHSHAYNCSSAILLAPTPGIIELQLLWVTIWGGGIDLFLPHASAISGDVVMSGDLIQMLHSENLRMHNHFIQLYFISHFLERENNHFICRQIESSYRNIVYRNPLVQGQTIKH